ncbi:MAG: glycine dehydrogenase subunit 2 [Thermotogae bacterium]|nr:glycine dehydrogenase subunit 2 [Thermotogota bacterium]
MLVKDDKVIFEKNRDGVRGFPVPDFPKEYPIPQELRRTVPLGIPNVPENEVVRHYVRLSQKNWGVDIGFYPLGSCTMKYNPKFNEDVARLPQLTHLHPNAPDSLVQGALRIMYELQEYLKTLTGMEGATLQPVAGASGELTGILMIKAYLKHKGEGHRDEVLIPDSAHGTNPATASMAGFKAIEVRSNTNGTLDVEDLKAKVSDRTVGLMITNPNTLGLFEREIKEITRIVHEAGGQVYMDGANFNALMGWVSLADLGIDVVHLNLHKTFSTPHGGGGPGAGVVLMREHLWPFTPVPTVEYDPDSQRYHLNWDKPLSIGKMHTFYGHFLVMVRAYAYILSMGGEGLKQAAADAVLNANYLRHLLEGEFKVAYPTRNMHEFVLTAMPIKRETGVRTYDIAKRLLDYGFHAPTVYFPLIVPEALMIEPTETETKETLEAFAEALIKIKREAYENPELVKEAPHTTPVGRLDEVKAAKQLKVKWESDT